ncbi:hypothetical protein [Synechococcus sp. EJ6-Ellesmere]|uniref:hypothetical protein n=1 Tax=Synechococcus sp. EJ6-Ellesmere TaxID=2823734 RepID=UPI0020CD2314|nr:hypothetical protein [Synechococcus sp. EJ6-Ellesmere]MCP9825979.1 hypothetical protein [Synechococcus sp. EJ6-Ellesmere]
MDTAMPLQLLQPLDSNNPASTPVHLSGPEQRLTVTPDPGVGDESLLPPSQLLIVKDGESRSIWPVHLAGWLALGWQLHTESPEAAPEPEPLSEPEPEPQPSTELVDAPDLELEQPEATEPASAPDETTPTDEPLETTADGGEALLASEPTDFQAMTKAQIVEFCSTVYGVELDSSQTKAELVEQATALEAQASGSSTATSEGSNDAAELAALELGDALR